MTLEERIKVTLGEMFFGSILLQQQLEEVQKEIHNEKKENKKIDNG